jgi:hypothetical protein
MRDRTLVFQIGIVISIALSLSAIFPLLQVYSQTNTSLSGNNSDKAILDTENAVNTTTLNIRLVNDQNSQNSIYSSALTALVGAGSALIGSALTYVTTTRTSRAEKQKQQKYNSSLKEIVSVELEEYVKVLTSIKDSMTRMNGYYYFNYDEFHKNRITLKEISDKKSIFLSVPLEKRVEAIDPKPLVKVLSVYDEFKPLSSYLMDLKYDIEDQNGDRWIKMKQFDDDRLAKLLTNLSNTITLIK